MRKPLRYLKYLFLLILTLVLVGLAFANSQLVTLTALSEELVPYFGGNASIEVPLYAIGFGGLVLGLLIGFFWEWMRERHYRSEASSNRREKAALAAELKKMKRERNEHEDDVLALLEQPKPAR